VKLSPWPHFDQEQIDAVQGVLKSGRVNYWTGQETKEFEKEFLNLSGTKFCLAVANGSVALSAAYIALGLKKGDEIITTPRTFIATSSCAVLLGIKPVFADVDIDSGNITADSIAPHINKNTKAISVVHIGGWPADMDKINKLARNFNLKIIEDCSQAHGAKINGKNVGSFGDIAVWSFCQDKIISTAGEGGMIATNNENLYDKIWSLRDHGKSRNEVYKQTNQKSFRWLHESFGTNLRITEIQSSIGRIQLKNLNNTIKKRQTNANIIDSAIKDLNIIRIPKIPKNVFHARYKYYVYLNKEKIHKEWDREKILSEINKMGFPAFSGTCGEIYLEKCFKNNNLEPKLRLTNAKIMADNSLMFLVHPTIDEKQMNSYSEAIKNILIKASK
tara:strand:- start:7060 stop:8226 length:1167 start_codon:yes stop_codon:yes gene_type:complete